MMATQAVVLDSADWLSTQGTFVCDFQTALDALQAK